MFSKTQSLLYSRFQVRSRLLNLSLACSVVIGASLMPFYAHAEPTVNGNIISWPDDGWYQVQSALDYSSICNGGSSCEVMSGTYNVINHTTGQRWDNISVTSEEPATGDDPVAGNEPVVTGSVIRLPSNGWYEVQEADTYLTLCQGVTLCGVEPGTYNVINHTTGQRFEGIVVRGSEAPEVEVPEVIDAPSIMSGRISWPDDGSWYQVLRADDFSSVCNGGTFCDVPNGGYVVINHRTGQRWNVAVFDGMLPADFDGDGFSDAIDPAPFDSTVPGNFSTPEAILNNSQVQQALREASALGFTVSTLTDNNPPDLSGYYIRADRAGSFPFNSAGFDVGGRMAGSEVRLQQSSNNTYTAAEVFFTSERPVSFEISEGTMVRGEGNAYTTYSRSKGTCTEDGSDYDFFSINITSATLNPITSDIESTRNIGITVAVDGTLTDSCADRLVGERELVGSWSASEVAFTDSVEPNSLVYMCVADNFAYAPTETWTGEDGRSCSCTTDYQISCE